MSTITTGSQPAASPPLKRLISGHPLVTYFVIAYAGTWILFLPLLLSRDGFGLLPFTLPGLVSFLPLVGGSLAGPTLAAFLVTAATSGKAGVRQLLRRYVQWRVGIGWYLLALLSFPLVFLISASIFYDVTTLSNLFRQWSLLFTLFLPLLLTLNLANALGEEPGWRGFALPRLQQRLGPVLGTIVLGTLHACWHLPAFFVRIGPFYPFTLPSFAAFVLLAIAGTSIYTWIFNHARGSILIAILIHSASDTGAMLVAQLRPAQSSWSAFYFMWGDLIIAAVVAVLLIVFTRGRLGYQAEQNAQLIEVPRPAEMPSTVEVEQTGHS
jgi:membrane protease YdiL (CAAX protease family)